MSLIDNGFIPTEYAITEMGIVNGLLLTGVRDAYHFRRIVLTSMQCRDEHDLVPILQFVVAFALQLPVCIVYEHKYPRSPTLASASFSTMSTAGPHVHRPVLLK